MIRSKITMGSLWTALLVLLHVLPGAVGPVHGQGTRKDDIVFNSRGVPLAGASVRVCAMPASGQPCSPLAQIYADAGLTQAIANPTTTDGLGNYFFYGAPGKYEIEISGPGIITKQLPNVILPSDPSSPTFSGGVSAFSLNLGGNLTVNGSASVIGSLASGTLTLSNQNTPPGAASAGTVNLYSKTTDKRLYYKDDTGSEIGPISVGGSGAQTNVVNTFTASQNFSANVQFKGPNPYYDLTQYGLYAGNGGAINCSTTASNTAVTCSSIGDFAVGQGIEIPTAGVASTFAPWGVANIANYSRSSNVATYNYTGFTLGPGQTITIAGLADATFNGTFTVLTNDGDFGHFTVSNTGSNLGTTAGSGTATLTSAQVTVTPQGILNGTTTYSYKVVLRGYNGELSAASNAGTTSTGATTIGVNAATLTSCSRSSGVATCTSSAAHNFQAGVSTDVEGVTNTGYNGSHVIAATPTSTTFTFLQSGVRDDSVTATGGTAKVVAKNMVRWNTQQYANIQAIIYRSINGGAYSIAGIEEGMDGSWVDWGLGAPVTPGYVPATPPSSATNGILATRITAISGTTLTVANAATASVSGQASAHDNTPVVLAACAAMPSTTGGILFIPAQNPVANIPFNSPLDFYHNCAAAQPVLQLASAIVLNDPVIPKQSGLVVRAAPGSAVSGLQFVSRFTSQIYGSAYPFFYVVPGSFGPFTLENLAMNCQQQYQSCVVQDQDAGGGGVVDMNYDNDYFIGNGGSMPFILRSGGFNHWFDRGAFVINTGGWGVPEALQITVPNSLGINPTLVGFPYIVKFDKTFWVGHGIDYNDFGLVTTGVAGRMVFNEPLIESSYTPWLSLNLTGLSSFVGTTINNLNFADILSGPTTPVIESTNAQRLAGLVLNYSGCGNSAQPLLAGNVLGGVQISAGAVQGCGTLGITNAIVTSLGGSGNTLTQYAGIPLQFTGTGQAYYVMSAPGSPALALSAGGAVPVGVHNYQITAIDANGNTTLPSVAASVTTTSGNQTVSITPTLPPGAIGYVPYRDGAKVNYGGSGCSTFTPASTPFVDALGSVCGNALPTLGTAGVSSLTSAGLAAPQVQVVGGGYADTLTGNFTAPRAQQFADVSGIIPVTGYLNTAYDNFNRANGAIGSNWTVNIGGFNVASNAVIGTGSSNIAYFSAGGYAFSNAQFAQVQVATLNGATDFVGVDVLLSAANNGYTCVENNASLILQKLTAGTGSTLASSSSTGAPGDILRLEAAPGGVLTCSRTAIGGALTSVTATDTTFTGGSPAIEQFGSTATMDNWSGGNLHPLGQLDIEQDWARTQHFAQGLAIGTETVSASPRAEQNIFLPGALTSTWTGSTWNTDKAITITRVQVQAKTAPAGCTTNAVVRLTDGTSPVNVTVAAAANDSGTIAQSYAAGAGLTVAVQTGAAGCSTSPADVNVVVQYKMQ